MNIIGMLRPKFCTTYLEAEDTLRDGLTVMKTSGYAAVPVIDREGRYVGTVREGDFLWQILDKGESVLDDMRIRDIIKKGWNLAATDEADVEALMNLAMEQNFIPVVDDRECYIGLITRRDIMKSIRNRKEDYTFLINTKALAKA